MTKGHTILLVASVALKKVAGKFQLWYLSFSLKVQSRKVYKHLAIMHYQGLKLLLKKPARPLHITSCINDHNSTGLWQNYKNVTLQFWQLSMWGEIKEPTPGHSGHSLFSFLYHNVEHLEALQRLSFLRFPPTVFLVCTVTMEKLRAMVRHGAALQTQPERQDSCSSKHCSQPTTEQSDVMWLTSPITWN